MTQVQETVIKPRPRLMFIDLARSIAILLMLEGHFIDSMLAEPFRDPENPIFFLWKAIRGFTAPLFFTVSGLVFVYLLTNFNEKGFFKNKRVKKGFNRSLELILWGYFLQINVFELPNYLKGEFHRWDSAFHVLQCIGVSIAVILVIYGFYKLIRRKIPLWALYFAMGTLIWGFYPYFMTIPEEVFLKYPWFIQNMFIKPYAVFCVIPWVGFAMYGAMLGSIVNLLFDKVKTWGFSLSLIGIGIILSAFGKPVFFFIDTHIISLFGDIKLELIKTDWIFGRLGQVLIILGLLIIIEKHVQIKNSLFLKIGQNTLSIFIWHFVILYGGVFGFGIGNTWGRSLDPWPAIFGAVGFILIFAVFIKYIDPLNAFKDKLKAMPRLAWDKLKK